MRMVFLALSLVACGQGAAPKAVACLLPKDASTALFSGSVDATAQPVIAAAMSAGEVVAAAASQAEEFDRKVVEIAKDPAASEQWSKVAPSAEKSRAVGLATELPASAERLRKAGTAAADVSAAIDGAVAAHMVTLELSDALTLSAKAAETYGPVKDFGSWFTARVVAGDRGAALADAIEVEHQSKGEKSGADKVEICHSPPGNPDNKHTISVGSSALSAHLGHGDVEGPCDGADDGKGGGRGAGSNAHRGGKPEGKGGGSGKGKALGKGKH